MDVHPCQRLLVLSADGADDTDEYSCSSSGSMDSVQSAYWRTICGHLYPQWMIVRPHRTIKGSSARTDALGATPTSGRPFSASMVKVPCTARSFSMVWNT